ncbi:MAG: ATP-dependent protease LonB [Candidatus Micrarchaeia archaeon]
MNFKTTADIKIPEKLIDQVIGQDKAVEIVKKAARQRRNLLIIGPPGTGKSLLAQAMAELMPPTELEDVLVYPNPNDENTPLIRVVKTYPKGFEQIGQGRKILEEEKNKEINIKSPIEKVTFLLLGIALILFLITFTGLIKGYELVVFAAVILGLMIFASSFSVVFALPKKTFDFSSPKLIVDNTGRKTAPFIDATGAKAGALLGDVRHDPLQSGGLGTPAHLRVEAGAIHKANKGVLFIDEVSSLSFKSQQELLTAMQEKKYPITGQSEMSSGAIVRTEPVPCDFVLVAAGNLLDLKNMHPALRSRIRGYGYEIYLNDTMPDTKKNREKIIQFIAQEVKKDGKIPHFDKEACDLIIQEARKRANRKNALSIRFRELGGIVRAAGDIAITKNKKIVTKEDVLEALKIAKSLEAQIAEKEIEIRKQYKVFKTKGYEIGVVNGLAVFGAGDLPSAGIILPIVSEVTPASSRAEGKLIATGKLGKIAKEAVDNVSAIIKKDIGKDVSAYDIHVQFLQTYEGVEGDSASISIAVSVLSAMHNIPVSQEVAMTGSLSVRGKVLPVGGISQKVEAAIDAGIKKVIIPRMNLKDISIPKEKLKKIKIIAVSDIVEVLQNSLKDCKEKEILIQKLKQAKKEERKVSRR